MKMPDPEHVERGKWALDFNDEFPDSGTAFPDIFESREEWLETRVASLLSDIRHYCHARGIDYYAAEYFGYRYYLDSLVNSDD